MFNVKRWYIYLVSIISLEAVVWSFIGLVRDLLVPDTSGPSSGNALQIAVLIIGLPVFLAHWLWAQRLAQRVPQERASTLRHFYLYTVVGACLVGIMTNAFDLLKFLIGTPVLFWERPTVGSRAVTAVVPLVVLPLVALYHWLVLRGDVKSNPATGELATVRRLFVLIFSAAGLVMTSIAVVELGGWIVGRLGDALTQYHAYMLSGDLARLLVGLPVWVLFWLWAQRLAHSGDEDERRSALRSTYLYSAVFVGVLAFVTTLTVILSDLLKRLLGVVGIGEGTDVVIPALITSLAVWAYHAYMLRQDAQASAASSRQTSIRRGYFYVTAAIGLVAWLAGLAGAIGVLMRTVLGHGLVTSLRGDLATFIALIAVGLPVWLLSWRRIQHLAAAPGDAGEAEIASTLRKFYLYLCLFVSTMTVLGSGVYVVAKIVGTLIGVDDNISTTELSDAIAFSLLAAGVWLYHGAILRGDNKRLRQEGARRLAAVHVTVLDTGDGSLGRALLRGLGNALPGLDVKAFGLTQAAATSLGGDGLPALATVLAGSQVIIAPWTAMVSGASGGAAGPSVAEAVAASPAHKVLLPTHEEQWTLAGAGRERQEEMVKQAVHAVEQIAHGEDVKPKRSLGLGGAVALVAGGLLLLGIVASLVTSLISSLLFY